jgi:acetyl-CoA carboxylase biotin carboxyl carrier protein
MVGTFYAAPSPRDEPFVQENDEIHAGDTVGIIEAMKIMNEVESEVTGRVTRILVQNAQPVEYGQPLMVIEPLS